MYGELGGAGGLSRVGAGLGGERGGRRPCELSLENTRRLVNNRFNECKSGSAAEAVGLNKLSQSDCQSAKWCRFNLPTSLRPSVAAPPPSPQGCTAGIRSATVQLYCTTTEKTLQRSGSGCLCLGSVFMLRFKNVVKVKSGLSQILAQ